jgi:hypothetical protein
MSSWWRVVPVVYPAAGFLCSQAQRRKLAILNRTPTDQDGRADLVIRDGIGATLSAALALL